MFEDPTRDEIERWKAHLDDHDFQRPLLQFQRSLYETFESLRRETGLRPIRGIIFRDEVKSVESLVEKVARKRREQNEDNNETPGKHTKPYDFEDVQDLVGVKILCPFRADAEEVAKYLFAQTDRIRVVESDIKAGRRDDPEGYRGFNFTVYPAMGRRFELTSLYCELQIKTLIEEAWDAMTHDLTYKRKQAISPGLLSMFTALSTTLKGADQQGEAIKGEIEDFFAQFTEHRHAAAVQFFTVAINALNGLRDRNEDLAIPELADDPTLDEDTFSPDVIAAINEALRRDIVGQGLRRDHCRIATLVALCSQAPGEVAYAVRLASDLVMKSPRSAGGEIFRASILWALGRFDISVESAELALSKSIDGDENADFCYFVADAKVFHAFIPAETEARALELAQNLVVEQTPAAQDTAGFVLIVFGPDDETVQCGIRLVNEALSGSKTLDAQAQKLAKVFCARHLKLGQLRLDNKAWWV